MTIPCQVLQLSLQVIHVMHGTQQEMSVSVSQKQTYLVMEIPQELLDQAPLKQGIVSKKIAHVLMLK